MALNITSKMIAAGIIVLFVGTLIPPSVLQSTASADNTVFTVITKEYSFDFSVPLIQENDKYTTVSLEEGTSYLTSSARPMLPTVTKTFQFPQGTIISHIDVILGNIHSLNIGKKVRPVPTFEQVGDDITEIDSRLDESVYGGSEPYPSSWYSVSKGAGITSDGNHVLFCSLQLQPIQFIPQENTLRYIDHITVRITSQEPVYSIASCSSTYDLVIIAPTEFSDYLPPLVSHKNNHGMKTNLVTVEDIYSSYPGRDHVEKIKYFVKYALETWGIKYVLLIGDITRMPIRSTDAYPWKTGKSFGGNILTDLYYADIYDENFSFCSWDANNNSVFGEVTYGTGMPPSMNDSDKVDLYPDVSVGRLPCTTIDEVRTLVDKIITYEDYTYDQIWFKRIILAGGDTFPPGKGSPRNIFEGEITNTKVAQQLPGFEHIFLWSSKYNLNAITFNRAINQGAGFLSYAGHGFEHGWGTYRPNFPRSTMGITQPLYYTPFIKFLRNGDKLPIMFFDACLTAKLDFNISDLARYYPNMITLLQRFTMLSYVTPSDYFPCFAYSFLLKTDGGAIAAVGATRPAYTLVDENGVYGGAGYLDVHFFKAYKEGVTVGQMFTQTQTDYLNNVGNDYFTIEEFILLGDPSLMVGGYPSMS